MSTRKIIKLSRAPEGFGQEQDELETDMFVSDLPTQHTHEYFEDEDLGLYVGVWDTTGMTEAAGPYACDEFMLLLQGEAGIKNSSTGAMESVVSGETFIIPRGYDCQWHQEGYLRKYFVIYENPNEPQPAEPTVEGIIIPSADAQLSPLKEPAPFQMANKFSGCSQNICYENSTGKFQVGTWACEPLESEPARIPCHHFACIVSGSVSLLDDNGDTHQFSSGDAWFIPEGVLCSAKIHEKTRMIFAIVKPA